MSKIFFLLFGVLICTNTLFGDAYYYKGKLVELKDKKEFAKQLEYTKGSSKVYINNKIILKTLHDYETGYFEKKYGLKQVKNYGKVYIFEVNNINDVVPFCKTIYENESVVYVQPSFAKKLKSHNIKLESSALNSRPLSERILSHANEDTKSMLDSLNTVNYWKYYDDVFRYEDESFWHLYNKGGFISQAYYQDEFYDVLSHTDVDTNVLEVIDSGITGKGIKIAVVDSSFELSHPDLRFSDSYNFFLHNKDVTPNSNADFHGTSVAGVIAANRGNNYGIMGVAPDAYMMAFNGLFEIEEDEVFTQSYIEIFYKALEFDVDIINCSWTTLDMLDEASEDAINTFIDEARDGKGGFVVFSSGNEGSTSLSSEAALPNVISVGSIEVSGARSLYSNFGSRLDLVAPTNFVSIDLIGANGFEDNEMGFIAGTSFSAPMVSGVIALILEANQDLSADEVKNIIYSTTKKVGSGDFTNNDANYEYKYNIDTNDKYNVLYSKSYQTGYGLIDANASVVKAKQYKEENIVSNDLDNNSISFLSEIKSGWNFVGVEREIVDLSVFDNVEIAWCYLDGDWKGYSPNLEYSKELRKQDKLFTLVPKNSGLWVFKDED